MKNRFARFVAALVLGCVVSANAQVYRCSTPGGGTEYSQVPCGKDAVQVQSRKNSIDTGPPTDPFGVQRDRERMAIETEQNRQKFWNGVASARQSPAAPAPRQIDSIACERADRDAHIESRHARQDKAQIKRKQDLADYECGRTVAIRRDEAQPAAYAPQSVPVPAVPLPPPSPLPDRRNLTNCDSNGCYDNTGARYNNMGENFMGPTGMCRKTLLGWSCP